MRLSPVTVAIVATSAMAFQSTATDAERFWDPVRLSRAGGRSVLDAVWGEYQLKFGVDDQTKLPASLDVRREIPSKTHPATPNVDTQHFEFDHYETVAGISLPGRVKFGHDWSPVSFIINPDVDPKLFEALPGNVTSADAWRKWLK